jgi:hypothetical protein
MNYSQTSQLTIAVDTRKVAKIVQPNFVGLLQPGIVFGCYKVTFAEGKYLNWQCSSECPMQCSLICKNLTRFFASVADPDLYLYVMRRCPDKTFWEKASKDIIFMRHNVCRDKRSGRKKHPEGQNIQKTKCPWGQNIWRDKTSKRSFWHIFNTDILKTSKTILYCIASSLFFYIHAK